MQNVRDALVCCFADFMYGRRVRCRMVKITIALASGLDKEASSREAIDSTFYLTRNVSTRISKVCFAKSHRRSLAYVGRVLGLRQDQAVYQHRLYRIRRTFARASPDFWKGRDGSAFSPLELMASGSRIYALNLRNGLALGKSLQKSLS